jgi:hypothetical protein
MIRMLLVAAVLSPAVGYKFMAIGDWGASYQNDDCSGTVSVQQQADAVAMVRGSSSGTSAMHGWLVGWLVARYIV